eukprot:gene1361-2632_t
MPTKLWIFVGVCIVLNQITCRTLSSSFRAKNTSFDESVIKWGKLFQGVRSKNLNLNCKYRGFPICCSALSDKRNSTQKALTDRDIQIINRRGNCRISRVYIPSPYETRHYSKAVELGKQTNDSQRKSTLIEFLSSYEEVQSTIQWMERVRIHMTTTTTSTRSKNNNKYKQIHYTDDDFEYLSYFNVTRHCDGNKNKARKAWIEWIEPLSMHTRDPFSLWIADNEMKDAMKVYMGKNDKNITLNIPFTALQSNDYILLRNGDHMSQYELDQDHRIQKNSKYLLDTGTSRFDSSLWWFTCGYAQRGIELDQLFGWEATLLEPKQFWRKVPPRWRQSYHFFNTPISSDPSNEWHPLRFIQAMGIRESDFVSFKLDIDTVDVELPIALELLTNSEFSSLIDEFFFELHFKCEILEKIWTTASPENRFPEPIPASFGEMKLVRAEVLGFFGQLRQKGIRAHFWP